MGSPWLPAFSPIISFHKGLSAYSLSVLFLLDLLHLSDWDTRNGEISGRGPHCVPELTVPPSAER